LCCFCFVYLYLVVSFSGCVHFWMPLLYSLTFMYSYIMRGAGGMLHFDSTMIMFALYLTNILSLIIYCASSLRQQSSLLHSDAWSWIPVFAHKPKPCVNYVVRPIENRTSCWYTPCLLRIQANLKANIIACIARSILAYFVLFTSNSIFTSKKQNILFSVLINVEGNIWKGCKHGYLFRHRESVYNFLW
jgi:hypothetical protein